MIAPGVAAPRLPARNASSCREQPHLDNNENDEKRNGGIDGRSPAPANLIADRSHLPSLLSTTRVANKRSPSCRI